MPDLPKFDLDRARRDTPGCEHVIHLNNAGAALMPEPVIHAVTAHVRLEAERGGYEAEQAVADRVSAVYDSLAALLNCKPSEVAVVENATRAWDMAFYSIKLGPGDRILTSMAEYASNFIAFLQRSRISGASVEVVPNDESGQLATNELERMLDETVRVVAVTHVPTNSGLVNPAEEIGKIVRQGDALYMLDACQSIGQMPVDVQRIGCDLLSTTGRKYLRAPRGVGALCVREDVAVELEPPLLDLHAATWTSADSYEIRPDARRFENWEANIAAKLGLGAAVDYLQTFGIEAIWKRIAALAEELRRLLLEIQGVRIVDPGTVRCGIVSFTCGLPPQEVLAALRGQAINVWTSGVASTRLDMESRQLSEVVRSSVHYYNSSEELLSFRQALHALLTT
jgi:cysteine desulfurase / selenocysteine lyase